MIGQCDSDSATWLLGRGHDLLVRHSLRQFTGTRFLGLGIEIAIGLIGPLTVGAISHQAALHVRSLSSPRRLSMVRTWSQNDEVYREDSARPYDFSDVTERVLAAAEQMAREFRSCAFHSLTRKTNGN